MAALSNFLIAKLGARIKILKFVTNFGTENALFGYFWLEFEKGIAIFEINTIKLF